MHIKPAARAALVVGAATLVLSGCASLPPSMRARLAKAPESYAASATFNAPSAEWPTNAWWTRYGDSQLDALMTRAIAGSPTLAEAEARVRRAQATRAVAAGAELPSLAANASVQEMKQSSNNLIPRAFLPSGYQDYGQATLNLNFNFDLWGKTRAAVAAATSEAAAASAEAAQARLILTTDVASAYADLARLRAERDVAVEAIRLREETATLAGQRVANGLDTQAELKQAQAGAPAARANLAAIDEAIAQTRDALAALTGDGPDAGLAVTLPNPAHLMAFGLPADLRAHLVGRRPDVVAAKWRAAAAGSRVTQAKAAFYPDVNIAAYIGQQSLHVDRLLESGSSFGAVGPALSLPIFQGGTLRGTLRGAQADRDAAVAAYDAAVTRALREVADVVASERALAERREQSRLALVSYEGAYRVARLRYEGGLSTFQSVLLAEDAVLNQRRVVSDLDSRAFSLDIALVRALGGGFAAS
jgi:NodT family efflux transporter outer membrane factor (OMF) lipoprotein